MFELIYPSFCPHCLGKKQRGFLCPPCSEEIELVHEKVTMQPSLLNGSAYALELEGANLTLHRMFCKDHNYLTDGLAQILYLKWLRMRWPKMDLIVSLHVVPFYKSHPDKLLKKGLERLLKVTGKQEGNVLIVSTLFHVEKLQKRALEISRKLPKSVYALSLWNP